MISQAELEAWSKLYERAYESFEIDDETLAARTELNRELTLAYERLLPGRSISFHDFRRAVIVRIRALLKERRPRRRR
jgi:hypothetical protein